MTLETIYDRVKEHGVEEPKASKYANSIYNQYALDENKGFHSLDERIEFMKEWDETRVRLGAKE